MVTTLRACVAAAPAERRQPPLSPARLVGQALSALRTSQPVRRLSKARDAVRAKIDSIRSALEATSGGRGLSDGGNKLREQLRAADASLAELDAQTAAAARVQSHRVDAAADIDALAARVDNMSVATAATSAPPPSSGVDADSLADFMGGLTVAGPRVSSTAAAVPPPRRSSAGGGENESHSSNGQAPDALCARGEAACSSMAGGKASTAPMSGADAQFVRRMQLKQKIKGVEVCSSVYAFARICACLHSHGVCVSMHTRSQTSCAAPGCDLCCNPEACRRRQ